VDDSDCDPISHCIFDGDGIFTICGTDGDDVINGTGGVDVICAGAGNDVIQGKGDDDWIAGGEGNDVILGGNGSDWIVDGEGDNEMEGGAGVDWVFGGPGDDLILGDAGNDVLVGCGGRDHIDGGRNDDQLFISGWPLCLAPDDVLGTNLCGGPGNDTINGSGPGHVCVDAGADQDPEGHDCVYTTLPTPADDHDVGTQRNCANPTASFDPDRSPPCGCD
jgi:Ca2+-binding RTX toxin-like protein